MEFKKKVEEDVRNQKGMQNMFAEQRSRAEKQSREEQSKAGQSRAEHSRAEQPSRTAKQSREADMMRTVFCKASRVPYPRN